MRAILRMVGRWFSPRTSACLVRFSNRDAVRRFQEARKLLDEAIDDSPWNDNLKLVKQRLDEAWLGLAFSAVEEEPRCNP